MRNLIKCFAEVQYHCVDLLFVTKALCEVVHGEELGVTQASLPEAKLVVGEDVIAVQVVYDLAMDNVLDYFAGDGCERDGSSLLGRAYCSSCILVRHVLVSNGLGFYLDVKLS